MPQKYRNYIGGEWVASETGETFENRNPADPSDVIGRFQQSNAADTERGIEAAAAAKDEWADMPGPKRAALMREIAGEIEARSSELAKALTREEGKAISGAKYEIGRAVQLFEYYAGKARDYGGSVVPPSADDSTVYTVKEPLGVVGLITPWNFPVGIPIWKMAPALAMGNTVVFKPASPTPNVMRKLFECFDAVDLPDGVVNYVTGPGSKVGSTILSHEDVSAVSFTGSTDVGTHIYREAATNGKRVQTEMGGKNPTVVMPSADLNEAIEAVGSAGFSVAGQACTACSRAIVHESVYDEFVAGLVDYAETMEIGPGLEDPDMGPHVSESELESTLKYVEIGKEEGATLETGGKPHVENPATDGYFIEPAVFSDVSNDMRIAQEEIFGPVVSVIRVSDFEEGLRIANDTDYGLSASIMTDDLTEANTFLDGVEAGMAKVNDTTTGLELHAPFGGIKDSSSETWREQGNAALEFFTFSKTNYVNY